MTKSEQILSQLLFSETKDPLDAIAIAHVVLNRMAKPKRYGEGLEGVIFKPKQFSGVGTKEWKKAESGKMTNAEKLIYKDLVKAAKGVLVGIYSDPTNGATHYFNPRLVSPVWAEGKTKTYSTDYHFN